MNTTHRPPLSSADLDLKARKLLPNARISVTASGEVQYWTDAYNYAMMGADGKLVWHKAKTRSTHRHIPRP